MNQVFDNGWVRLKVHYGENTEFGRYVEYVEKLYERPIPPKAKTDPITKYR